MTELEIWILLLSVIVALSGWAHFIYERITDKPRVKGEICNVLTADIIGFDARQPDRRVTSFTILLYLTNTRRNSVHILEYQLEVDLGHGYEKVRRFYHVHNIKDVKAQIGRFWLEIPDYEQLMIYRDKKPVEYGKPLYGLVLFGSEKPRSYFKGIRKYRITCIDVFEKRHRITSSPDRLERWNLSLLSELFGLKLTEK